MRILPLLALTLLQACRAPLPERDSSDHGGAKAALVAVEPAPIDGRIQPVSRFLLAGTGAEVLLFRGTLSAYHLGKIRNRDLPKTLLERRVPTLDWSVEGERWVSPRAALELSERYSLASAEQGEIGVVDVVSAARAPLERVWPPSEQPASPDYWLFCGDQVPEAGTVEAAFLDPGRLPMLARVEAGTGCISLASPMPVETPAPLAPPLGAFGLAFEPASVTPGPPVAVEALACSPSEIGVGPGCIGVMDDRAVLRTPAVPTLWAMTRGTQVRFDSKEGLGRLVIRGLVPDSTEVLSLWGRDPFVEVFRGDVQLEMASPMPHVALNEVFANPLGPEPASEWVELYNDGTTAVELSEFVLRDLGGEVALPLHSLAPGAFALVVRDDFVAGGGADPAPLAGTALLRVASLGKNGLSNSGEALELVRGDGLVVSRAPGLPKPKAGVSLARRAPWTLDDEAGGFVHHAPPGASPGGANVVPD